MFITLQLKAIDKIEASESPSEAARKLLNSAAPSPGLAVAKSENDSLCKDVKPVLEYDGDGENSDGDEDIPDDAFHMITQYNWEDDIIWNGDDLKHKVYFLSLFNFLQIKELPKLLKNSSIAFFSFAY